MKSTVLRTQICLEPWQHQELKAMSRKTGKSISQIVRECLSASLTRPSPKKRDTLYNIVGMFDGEASNVGERHDEYLYGWKKKKQP